MDTLLLASSLRPRIDVRQRAGAFQEAVPGGSQGARSYRRWDKPPVSEGHGAPGVNETRNRGTAEVFAETEVLLVVLFNPLTGDLLFLLVARLEDRERDREKWQKAGLDDSDFDEEDAAYEALLSWQAQPLEDPYWQPAYTTGLVAIKKNRVIVANPDLFPTYIFDRTDQCDQVVAGGDPGEVRVVEKDVERGAMLVVLSSAFKTVPPSDVVAAASKCFGCAGVVERLCELLPEDSRATALVIQLLKPSKRQRRTEAITEMECTEDFGDQENGDGV